MSCSNHKKKTQEEKEKHAILKRQSGRNNIIWCSPHSTIHQNTWATYKTWLQTLKKEASDLASKVDNLTFAWSQDHATGKEYGLLAEIINNLEYIHLTNLIWIQEVEPKRYDPAIISASATHTRKCMEDEWEEKHKLWYIWKGFLCSVMMDMRDDKLDKQYYSQLNNINTAYRNTTPIQILKHLDTCWCPLNVQARKILKKEFYTDWNSNDIHITTFGMMLDKEQSQLDRLGIVISNKDKLQFYLNYASNCSFDKTEMVMWENKPVFVKDNYAQAKTYFKNLVKDFETYTQNSGGKTGKMVMKSPTTWQTWATRSVNISKISPVPPLPKGKNSRTRCQHQQSVKGKGCPDWQHHCPPRSSSSSTLSHFCQNHLQTRRITAAEETAAEEMAAEEMAATAVVLEEDAFSTTPETWAAATAGSTDIIQ
jgi:hypothetical protein